MIEKLLLCGLLVLSPLQPEASLPYGSKDEQAVNPFAYDLEIGSTNKKGVYLEYTPAQMQSLLAGYQRVDPSVLGMLGFFMSLDNPHALEAAAIVAKGMQDGIVHLQDPSDCVNPQNWLQTLPLIDQCNALRKNHGLPELKVDLRLVAAAIVQADASAKDHSHSLLYGIGENLAWGYWPDAPSNHLLNPFTGWYVEEKEEYENGHPENAGHFLNITNAKYQTTGFALGFNGTSLYDMKPSILSQTFYYYNDSNTYTSAQIKSAYEQYVKNCEAGKYLPVDASKEAFMFRLYNPNSGEHFYTQDVRERNFLRQSGWSYEGGGWIAPKSSNTPVYRLYNANAGDHHFTMDANERSYLIKAGWKDEGIGWYSAEKDGVALYRQYNPNAKAGSHNYTTDTQEHKYLTANGWKDEGICWHGLK